MKTSLCLAVLLNFELIKIVAATAVERSELSVEIEHSELSVEFGAGGFLLPAAKLPG
jgi:hypothetical protein